MKTLINWFYRLTDPQYETKIKSAVALNRTIQESTRASINHFYNIDGQIIRGFHKKPIRFNIKPTETHPIHPLLQKYQ